MSAASAGCARRRRAANRDPELLRLCIVQEEIINFTARQAQCKARNETQNYGADADGPQVHLLVVYQGNSWELPAHSRILWYQAYDSGT